MSDNTGDESGFVPVTVGQFLINIRTATGDIASSIAINLYQSTRNAIPDQTPIYAFAPYFVFYRQGQAVGSAKYLRIDSHNSHLVKLRLGLYDDALKKACAVWLSNKTEQPISPQQLQILPIWSLEVKETVTSVTYNLPDQDGTGPVAKLNLQPVQDILFSATQDKAAALAAAIDGGYANFQFRYTYKKADTVIGSYTVRYDDIRSSTVFQQVTGEGGVGFVTRNGAAQVGSAIASSLDVISYVEDDSTKFSLANDIINLLFDKMKFKESIDFANKENLKELTSISIDPRGLDFEAARLNTTHDILTTSHDFTELNKNLKEGGAAASYGPFSGNANFKSNDEVNQAIKDTFSHDWTGNNWSTVPKTVNVYQVNGSDFQGSAVVRQLNVRPTFGMEFQITTPTQVFPSNAELDASLPSP